ncbi:hypothetical protein AB0C18_29335 [Nonomuraea muscovyensis]|uniref:hypothetical protein n=1 Tax=Nonomuraea muscovyensis TaxID=1124761 RepID=UPI003403C694
MHGYRDPELGGGFGARREIEGLAPGYRLAGWPVSLGFSDYGIDLDDLDPAHSLTTDPTVVRPSRTAKLLGEDVWIAVKLPGSYEGDDDLPEGATARARRWCARPPCAAPPDAGFRYFRPKIQRAHF